MMKRGHDVESAPGIWRRRTAMEHYAGIDVSLERSSVGVVDALGKIVKEAKVSSEPAALVAFFLSRAARPTSGKLTSPGPLQKDAYSLTRGSGVGLQEQTGILC